MLFVICDESCVKCHMSCVTKNIFFYKIMKLVVGGSVMNGATPSSFFLWRGDGGKGGAGFLGSLRVPFSVIFLTKCFCA